MISRRKFLQSGALLGATTFAPGAMMLAGKAFGQAATTALNSSQVPKFVEVLPNPLDPAFIFRPDVAGGSAYTIQIAFIRLDWPRMEKFINEASAWMMALARSTTPRERSSCTSRWVRR